METVLEKDRQPIRLHSNLKKIVDLGLSDEKVKLMKESVFGNLSSVVNKRESSATLVEVLSKYYNSSNKMFELPNGIYFSFCSKEVADIIGMEDKGVGIHEYVQCPKASSKPTTLADLKKKLKDMSIDDDASKKYFKGLMSYFLVEQVLLCARDATKLRQVYWPVVENVDWRENCNWAKATWNQLHTSLADVKKWCATREKQHHYIGAASVLETIIYERIEKLRPGVHQIDIPLIQKYTSQRLSVSEWESKFDQLTSANIVICPHCTSVEGTSAPLSVQRTPAPFSVENDSPSFSEDNASFMKEVEHLSLSSIGDLDLDLEMHPQNEARVDDELEKSESEKQKLQESAENLIEECNTPQKSYEDMTKGNAELYDQYSCLVIELTSGTERNQKEVERRKHEISRPDEQKSTLTFEKLNLESPLKESDIHTVREEYERKIQELTTELAVVKKNHKRLIAEDEKKSKLLTSSEHEHQQLNEEAANLKDKVFDYKQMVEKLKNEKSNLEASLHSVSNSFEKLKAEKMSFNNKMLEFEDCKRERDALEEKLSRLEGDLTAKNASRLQDADMKNEISRMKSANLQYRLKIQQLEGEKKELLKKVDDLTGVHETRTQEDTDHAAKMKMLEAELDEALNANHKYRVELQKQKSKAEGEVVTKELFEKTKSSLETELKDLRERDLEMSPKYAQVEAERGDLVMRLKTLQSRVSGVIFKLQTPLIRP
ncbi:thyroid receptor-interacting protein 11-like [Helianthus annuus]|uniref:thyroid receptor-interacting protein 11-like n=1 Tax=Helianthus annuus TaxID=4232 RepID=UPI001652E529|nr:thyroid receptor-interacting protein 11-like [Helianthus annuus]